MTSDKNWNVVFEYSRAEAIFDGVLVDVTEQAKQIGFKIHTVVTGTIFLGPVTKSV